MSIRSKVIGLFVVILFLFVGVGLYSYHRSRQANARLALVSDLFLPLSRQVAQIQGTTQGLAEDIKRFYFQPSEVSSEGSALSRMARDLYPYVIHKRFTTAERLLNRPESMDLPARAEISALLSQARAIFDQLTTATAKEQLEGLNSKLRAKLQEVSRRVEDECQQITLSVRNEGHENLLSGLLLCALVAGFGLLTMFLSHNVLSPLPMLINSIKKIADGDFHQSLKVQSSATDEISVLAREYNRMLVALRDRDLKIQLQQKELLQSERLAAVGQLSAEVVHEIRNPLNSISLNIDWLQEELMESDPEVKKTLISISREIERLHQITESYLVRARVPVQDTLKTEVNELLQEILEFSREEDRSRNIHIDTQLAESRIFVKSDRSKLKQAFLNVMKNAREAMPRGGRLMVRTEVRDNVYRIQISDSGYGMNESTRRNTFQPFFTTKQNGTGLGLTLTKSIVEDAQGTLHCDSQIGQGTTFVFQFPV